MSKNSLLLERAEVALFPQSAHPPLQTLPSTHQYSELILRLFRGPSAVAFISPDAGPIATKVCARLAAELAESGRRVVIVQVETLLRMDRPPAPDETASVPGRVPNVWHWPGGVGSPTIDLFHSRPVATPAGRWIDSLARNFDCVLLDCPPLETMPQAAEVAALADAAVIVVEAGKTPKPQIQRTQQLLQQYNVKLAGCVLTGRR